MMLKINFCRLNFTSVVPGKGSTWILKATRSARIESVHSRSLPNGFEGSASKVRMIGLVRGSGLNRELTKGIKETCPMPVTKAESFLNSLRFDPRPNCCSCSWLTAKYEQ